MPEIDTQIDLNVTSYIPDDYISDSDQKIEIYQKIALCKTEEDIQNIIDEIIDRFGNMPNELENLVDIARIKYLAKQIYLEKIASKKTSVVFIFNQNYHKNKIELNPTQLIKKYGTKIKFSAGIKPIITLEIGSNDERKILNEVTKFIKKLLET